MRYAFLLSGAPRTILHCLHSFRPLIHPKHKVDIIATMWKGWLTEDEEQTVKDRLQPVVCEFPTFRDWSEYTTPLEPLREWFNGVNFNNFFNRCWGYHLVNQRRLDYERDHCFRYDGVFFCRPDMIFNTTDFDPTKHVRDDRTLLQSGAFDFDGWNDQFLYCSDAGATHLGHMIFWYCSLVKETVATDRWMEPEVSLKKWMTKANFARIPVEIDHKIMRVHCVGLPYDEISIHAHRDNEDHITNK